MIRLSSIFLWLYISSCQVALDARKGAATLTSIEKTAYEQHIEAINACLKSGGGKAMTEQERAATQQELRREQQARGNAQTISPASYHEICANYTSGTLESEQVRRCRYKLAIYPVQAIEFCLKEARDQAKTIKEQVITACQQAKAAKDKVKDKEERVAERNLKSLPLYDKLDGINCES